jgi:hypothetical protein
MGDWVRVSDKGGGKTSGAGLVKAAEWGFAMNVKTARPENAKDGRESASRVELWGWESMGNRGRSRVVVAIVLV